MYKKIIIIGVLGILICASITSNSVINNIIKKTTNLNRGSFEATLGIRDNERPLINLQGAYQYKGRTIIIQGTEDNRFSGIFWGNHFIIRTQIRGRIQNIYGKCRHSEDNSFIGTWSGRGFQNRGWINGAFTGRLSDWNKFEKVEFPIKNEILNTFHDDEPPNWATGYFYGVRGITDVNGQPYDPTEIIAGYCSDDFKGKFAGVIIQIETEEVTDYTGGKIVGPFMFGLTGDINTNEQTLIVGLGGSNETHFYFRAMSIVGPNNYLVGKYFHLE